MSDHQLSNGIETSDPESLKAQIAELEQQLQTTKAQLQHAESRNTAKITLPLNSSLHNLLLLADSALPLGSFAYSSGLESYLAHNKAALVAAAAVTAANTTNGHHVLPPTSPIKLFQQFLHLSIHTVAYTNIPYVLACYRHPSLLTSLDNDFDASTPCTVARRASVAQGRALLSVWEKAFAKTARSHINPNILEAATILAEFALELKIAAAGSGSGPASRSAHPININGHLAPIWGVAAVSLGLNIEEAGYVFLLNHAKAVISAAVRASVMGPYQAQDILASETLQILIRESLEEVWSVQPEDAGQAVPSMDLWLGRHELLYSRIFNS